MGRRLCFLGTIAFCVVLLAAVPALAGPPGKWTRVTGIEGVEAINTDELGLERTSDGVLHIAWTRRADALSDVLLHSALAADARSVAGPEPIVAPPNNGINPSVELVGVPGGGGGLRVLFAGLFPETPIDGVVASATAPAAGAPWSAPEPVSATGVGDSSVYAAAGIGGTVGYVGGALQPVFAWGDSDPSAGGYHVGISPLTPDVPFSPTASEVDPNVAYDIHGNGYVAWNDLAGFGGTNSLRLVPVGGGPELTAPQSAATWIGKRVSISGRRGAGGVYVAYGSGSNEFDALPAWWRVGAAKARFVKGQRDAEHVGLAPGSNGRLWLFWERDEKLYAARTNKKAARLGAIVRVRAPRRTSVVYNLQGEGSTGPLDLLALAEAKGGLGYFQQRILPGLSLAAKPRKAKAGKRVSFLVRDAGERVRGARVVLKLGKRKLKAKTNSKGKAVLRVPAGTRPGKYRALARRGGYAKAVARLRVKR